MRLGRSITRPTVIPARPRDHADDAIQVTAGPGEIIVPYPPPEPVAVQMTADTLMVAFMENDAVELATSMASESTMTAEAVRGGADPIGRPAIIDRRPPDPWLFELVTPTGIRVAAIPGRGRKLTLARNQPGAASFDLTTLEAAQVDGLVPGAVDLLVSRYGVDRWRGPLEGATGDLDATSSRLTFNAVGIHTILDQRFIPAGRSILATEQTQLAWQLIADTQSLPNGDLRITPGQLPDSVARSKTWDTRTPVRQAIDELAAAENGFDYEITPGGAGYVFNAFYPRQGSTAGTAVLEWGRNIQRVGLVMDATQVANSVTAVGQNQVSVHADDPASQGGYRLREHVVTAGDANDAVLLGDIARGGLVTRPPIVPRLTLTPGAPDASLDAIGLGDVVAVSVRHGWVQLDGLYRVEQIDVTIPDQGGPERLDVTVTPLVTL